MTAQPPLPLTPADAVAIGAAAGLVEDAAGGRVWMHGNLWLAWDAGDEVTRRLAATQLVATKAATATEVAAGFGVNRETLRRWGAAVAENGAVGLVSEPRGPKGPSRVTAEVVADIRARRAQNASLRAIAEATGVSVTSVRRALAEEPAKKPGEEPTEEPDAEPGVEEADAEAVPEAAADLEEGEDEGDEAGDGAGLPVLPGPADRRVERGLARWGLLGHAAPVFVPAARVPLAGLLVAMPGLEVTGLLRCAGEVYRRLPSGFYGLDTVLVESVLRCLVGEPRAEGATRIDPAALGRVLGLDRAPEVKTIRRKLSQLAAAGRAEELLAALARHHLHQAEHRDPGVAAVLYVDGHTRVYHGKRRIAKTHVARMRFPAPATVETWVADAAGDPVLVVLAEPGASLAGELRRLLPELRKAVGDDRRVLVGFDRGGWSPRLFKDMHQAGFDVLTWRKAPVTDVAEEEFAEVTYRDDQGKTHTWDSAETTVELLIEDKQNNNGNNGNNGNDKKGKERKERKERKEEETFAMRQVTRRDGPGGKQAHILTAATPEVLPAGEVNYRMGARWRQENWFRYGRMHFDLDSHDSYQHTDDDPGRSVPNPAKKHSRNAVAAARARYERETARADAALLELRSPTRGATMVITNADHDRATADQRAAEADLTAAETQNRATPARLPLGEVNPGQQLLEVQTKLLTHAVKIAAYNTATALARDLRLHTGYTRANHEAHTLIRQVLTQSGDIDPDPENGTLTVRLDPLPTARATRAAAELCAHLTDTHTRYPGTDLVLRYSIKPHHRP